MNLPYYSAFEAPFYDHGSEHTGIKPARRLNNGESYTGNNLKSFLLTGHKPFEASHQYSKLLRATIRSCLQFLPKHRATLQRLKKITEQERKMHMEKDESSGELWIKINGKMEEFRVGQRYVPPLEESEDEDE